MMLEISFSQGERGGEHDCAREVKDEEQKREEGGKEGSDPKKKAEINLREGRGERKDPKKVKKRAVEFRKKGNWESSQARVTRNVGRGNEYKNEACAKGV